MPKLVNATVKPVQDYEIWNTSTAQLSELDNNETTIETRMQDLPVLEYNIVVIIVDLILSHVMMSYRRQKLWINNSK